MTVTITINRRALLLSGLLLAGLALLLISLQTNPQTALAATKPCPATPPEPYISPASVLRLEHGYMIWIGDTHTIYVMYYAPGTNVSGSFESYKDTWADGMLETDPAFESSNHLWQPTRGFGKVWRENAKVKNGLGYGLSGDSGYMAVVAVQGNKMWINGKDNAFKFAGKNWEDVYAWRH